MVPICPFVSGMKKTCVFLGSKALGLSVLKALYAHSQHLRWVIIHPDDSSDPRSCLGEFNSFARMCDLDVMVAASAAAARQMIMDSDAEIGFVCGWYWMLDAALLESVPKGLWGAHNSLLPLYRGNAPLVWSIINGDAEVGCSVFRISKGMDDGEILHQVRVANSESDTVGTLLPKIEARLLEELPNKWVALLDGLAELRCQNDIAATYCGMRTPDDGLINWNKPAREVHDFIRAQSDPYPCAFSTLSGDKIRFVRTRIFPATFFGTPGQVLQRNKDSVLIACGHNTALEVLAVRVNDQDIIPSVAIKSLKLRFDL